MNSIYSSQTAQNIFIRRINDRRYISDRRYVSDKVWAASDRRYVSDKVWAAVFDKVYSPVTDRCNDTILIIIRELNRSQTLIG